MFIIQNELKGEEGSPGLKGEKGEPGGYYDPRYGGIGGQGPPGPPVRSSFFFSLSSYPNPKTLLFLTSRALKVIS